MTHYFFKGINLFYNFSDKQKSPKPSVPISFNRPRSSLPQGFDFSPPINPLRKLAKQPSTSTLVPSEGSLESNHIYNNPMESNPIDNNPFESHPNDTNPIKSNPIESNPIDSNPIDSNPIETLAKAVSLDESPKPTFRMEVPTGHPKRSSSLHVNECGSGSSSGLQKFFGMRRNHKFSRTISQPASPTGMESPSFRRKMGLFSRRASREDSTIGMESPSSRRKMGLFSRRASREDSAISRPLHVHINPQVVASSQSLVEQKNVRNLHSKSSDV